MLRHSCAICYCIPKSLGEATKPFHLTNHYLSPGPKSPKLGRAQNPVQTMSDNEPNPDKPSKEKIASEEIEATPQERKSSPNTNLRYVLGGLVVIAGVLGFFIFGKGCSGDPKKGKKTLTVEQLQRYEVGDFYRTIINTSVQGPIEGKDWGLKGIGTLLYQGEFDMIREVKEKEGGDAGMNPETDVKVALTVRRARDIAAAIELEDLQLDVPPVIGNALVYGASAVAGLKSGPVGSATVKIAADQLKKK